MRDRDRSLRLHLFDRASGSSRSALVSQHSSGSQYDSQSRAVTPCVPSCRGRKPSTTQCKQRAAYARHRYSFLWEYGRPKPRSDHSSSKFFCQAIRFSASGGTCALLLGSSERENRSRAAGGVRGYRYSNSRIRRSSFLPSFPERAAINIVLSPAIVLIASGQPVSSSAWDTVEAWPGPVLTT